MTRRRLGMCPAGLHGIDYAGQACDRCAHDYERRTHAAALDHADVRRQVAPTWRPEPAAPLGPAVPRESDDSLRTRIANAYGMWGAFLSEVIESSGAALDACARHVGVERRTGS